MGYIYKVTNTVNGKVYIGQTRRTIGERWTQHKYTAKTGRNKHRCLLYDAIKKYGIEVFTVEELEQCDDELLNEREIYWIKQYDSVRNGYNITYGGLGYARDPIPVVQFDLDGNYIQTFSSAGEAAKGLGVRPQGVYSVCDGFYDSWHGYQWRYLPDAEKRGMRLGKIKEQPKPKPVHQYTMDGDYVASFDSVCSAMAQFGAHGTGGIRLVCVGRNRYSYGYRWSYEKVDKLPPMREDKGLHPVARIDDDGNIIKIYPKMRDAARELNLDPCGIWAVCNGIHSKTGGYRFKYFDKEISQ